MHAPCCTALEAKQLSACQEFVWSGVRNAPIDTHWKIARLLAAGVRVVRWGVSTHARICWGSGWAGGRGGWLTAASTTCNAAETVGCHRWGVTPLLHEVC